jgi:hypothetical protein
MRTEGILVFSGKNVSVLLNAIVSGRRRTQMHTVLCQTMKVDEKSGDFV